MVTWLIGIAKEDDAVKRLYAERCQGKWRLRVVDVSVRPNGNGFCQGAICSEFCDRFVDVVNLALERWPDIVLAERAASALKNNGGEECR
jgi:hypothetical protein